MTKPRGNQIRFHFSEIFFYTSVTGDHVCSDGRPAHCGHVVIWISSRFPLCKASSDASIC